MPRRSFSRPFPHVPPTALAGHRAPAAVGALLRPLLTGLVVLAVACERPPEPPPVVAHVGDEVIRAPDLAAELERARADVGAEARLAGEELVAFRQAVLDGLVDRMLLRAEAARLGLTVSEADVEEAILRVRGEASTRDPVLVERLKARERERLLGDQVLLHEVVARVAIAPAEVRAFYDARKDEFVRGEQVRVQQLVVPRREDAEALKKELTRGVDFARLAREHSTSPDRREGGDLGWFSRGTMPAEFDTAAFALRKGQVSDVVQTAYGFHLFRLVDRRPGAPIPFAEVEEAIETQLKRDAIAKAQAAYLARLREEANVRIVADELAKVQ